MTGQPYSDKALAAAASSSPTLGVTTSWCAAMDAAHDREALGLDASVCARTFLDEIVEKLRRQPQYETRGRDLSGQPVMCLSWAGVAVGYLLREFGDLEPPTPQHVDEDVERSMQEDRIDIP